MLHHLLSGMVLPNYIWFCDIVSANTKTVAFMPYELQPKIQQK